jgi:hypothetical protein
MVVSTLDCNGVQTFMVDPAGVLIANTNGQARLRIYGQQRMNRFGYCVVQDFLSKLSILNYRDIVKIPLATKREILMVKTIPWDLKHEQMEKLTRIVDGIVSKEQDHYCFQIGTEPVYDEVPALIMNESKLSREELNRVDHWRHRMGDWDGCERLRRARQAE